MIIQAKVVQVVEVPEVTVDEWVKIVVAGVTLVGAVVAGASD